MGYGASGSSGTAGRSGCTSGRRVICRSLAGCSAHPVSPAAASQSMEVPHKAKCFSQTEFLKPGRAKAGFCNDAQDKDLARGNGLLMQEFFRQLAADYHVAFDGLNPFASFAHEATERPDRVFVRRRARFLEADGFNQASSAAEDRHESLRQLALAHAVPHALLEGSLRDPCWADGPSR